MTIIERLQKLLEAERSRVICLEQLAFLSPSKEINRFFGSMRNDASGACETLHSMILEREGYTTNEVSELAEKIMQLDSLEEILEFLAKDEKDVVAQIEGIPPEELKEKELEFMKTLWIKHSRNSDNCRMILRQGR
jgi:hypothetical protein